MDHIRSLSPDAGAGSRLRLGPSASSSTSSSPSRVSLLRHHRNKSSHTRSSSTPSSSVFTRQWRADLQPDFAYRDHPTHGEFDNFNPHRHTRSRAVHSNRPSSAVLDVVGSERYNVGFDTTIGSVVPRSVPSEYTMSSAGGDGAPQNIAPQADPTLSNATVTASLATPGSQQHLAPRENQPQPLDLMRRNQRPDSDRSRSRAKRRFSGSTANSSHSPGSDRGPHHREEGRHDSSGSSRRGPDSISIPARPAPWGVIGVCALDVKARSKPSRNILNRLIAQREFDVVVFGDKVILDEGKSSPRELYHVSRPPVANTSAPPEVENWPMW